MRLCRAYGTQLFFAPIPTAAAVGYRVPPARGGLVCDGPELEVYAQKKAVCTTL